MRLTFWSLLILSAASALAADPEVPWQKIETRYVPLTAPRQVLSPGLFDRAAMHMLVFKEPLKPAALSGRGRKKVASPVQAKPAAPLLVELGLPHAHKDAAGKARPSPQVHVAKDFVWIDFDNDGKPTASENKRFNAEGYIESFPCELFYDDGTSGKYAFFVRTLIEDERYALIRACARTFDFNGKTVTLLDDDGNGKYNDLGRDAVLVDGQPVCYPRRHICRSAPGLSRNPGPAVRGDR